MMKFLQSKRVACFIYSKSLKFYRKNSNKDLILQRQVLAHVCKIDVLKDFAKLTRKYLYTVFNEVPDLHTAALLQKRPRLRCIPVNVVKFLKTPFLKNSSRRLLLTLQVHKVDKSVSRYCNKDVKVISIEAILVTLCQLWKMFSMVRKLWKPPN